MKTASLSIRPYQQEWYNTVFLPAFEELVQSQTARQMKMEL